MCLVYPFDMLYMGVFIIRHWQPKCRLVQELKANTAGKKVTFASLPCRNLFYFQILSIPLHVK